MDGYVVVRVFQPHSDSNICFARKQSIIVAVFSFDCFSYRPCLLLLGLVVWSANFELNSFTESARMNIHEDRQFFPVALCVCAPAPFLNAAVRWKHVLLIFMTVTVNYAPSVSLIILLFLKYSIDLVSIAD